MKNITRFTVDTSDLSQNKNSRQFVVAGEQEAKFTLQVFDSAQKFYNFSTKLFTAGVDSHKNLKITMEGEDYNNYIDFPADNNGLTYTFLLITPSETTQINIGKITNSFSTNINQIADTTLSFNVATNTTGDYSSFDSAVTSSGSSTSSFTNKVQFDRTVKTAITDAGGFGLRLIRQPIDTDWYYAASGTVSTILSGNLGYKSNVQTGSTESSPTITLTAVGEAEATWAQQDIRIGDYVQVAGGAQITAGTIVEELNSNGTITIGAAATVPDSSDLIFITPSNKVIVNDLTGLSTGMVLASVSGSNSFLVGTPTIIAINTGAKEITLSSNQGFFPGITLNFEARGSAAIEKATGANIDFSNFNSEVTSATPAVHTTKVRTTATGTTVDLSGTYGISGGGFVTVSGRGFVNTSANTVQSVSASSTAGSMVMQVAQTVRAGTVLTFTGSSITIELSNHLTVKNYPTAAANIFLSLDNFITTGVQS